jgi:hypothetical protein
MENREFTRIVIMVSGIMLFVGIILVILLGGIGVVPIYLK